MIPSNCTGIRFLIQFDDDSYYILGGHALYSVFCLYFLHHLDFNFFKLCNDFPLNVIHNFPIFGDVDVRCTITFVNVVERKCYIVLTHATIISCGVGKCMPCPIQRKIGLSPSICVIAPCLYIMPN